MNAKKAQEFFSPYFEGELTGGLLDQFERTLKEDAQTQAEYKAFVRTMHELKALSEPVPEPDFDLHEAIARRIDRHFYELDRKPSNQFWTTGRKLLAAGVAGLAIVGGAMSILSKGNENQASPIPIPGSSPKSAKPRPATSISSTRLDLAQIDGVWTLSYRAESADLVTISSADAQKKETNLVANDVLESPLANKGDVAILIEVRSSTSLQPALIALPGSTLQLTEGNHSGRMGEFAVSLSNTFGVPVVVIEREGAASLDWTISSKTALAGLTDSVKQFGYSIEQKENGVIWIL